jgi:hypothetical protein
LTRLGRWKATSLSTTMAMWGAWAGKFPNSNEG